MIHETPLVGYYILSLRETTLLSRTKSKRTLAESRPIVHNGAGSLETPALASPMIRFTLLFTTMVLVGASSIVAEPQGSSSAKDDQFYQAKVYPILSTQCFSCHSHKEKKSKGGLMLDSRGAVLQGGDDGAVVVPGKPEESLLLKAVEHSANVQPMPPKSKLTDEQIAILKEWIQRGVPGPAINNAMKARPAGTITTDEKAYWAFQPVKRVEPPIVSDAVWGKNPLDRFIRDRLEKEGLQPSPVAEPHALIRRLYFDLVGLPPSPEEVAAFAAKPTEMAYEQMVDRLLASPAYGERWARFWLDLVRYAESDGYKADDYRPLAWRYRDYVISSFNSDKPAARRRSRPPCGSCWSNWLAMSWLRMIPKH
jgi:mono/diheme cytochrome c family protein